MLLFRKTALQDTGDTDTGDTFAGPLTAGWPPLLWASLGFHQAPQVTSASLRSHFLFIFQHFHCNMSGCGSLCVHPNWHLLSTWSVQMGVSHQLWGVVSHDFFDRFFSALSLSSSSDIPAGALHIFLRLCSFSLIPFSSFSSSDYVTSITLSSNLLLLSSENANLLWSPWMSFSFWLLYFFNSKISI